MELSSHPTRPSDSEIESWSIFPHSDEAPRATFIPKGGKTLSLVGVAQTVASFSVELMSVKSTCGEFLIPVSGLRSRVASLGF